VFGLGYNLAKAFTNPTDDGWYDPFPTAKTKYSFVTSYSVDPVMGYDFEKNWKNIARFYQVQEGYLFNQLLRGPATPNAPQEYTEIARWTSGDARKRSTMRQGYKPLMEEMPASITQKATMFKIVVDDSEYSPTFTGA
jgi:hypothetical protein